MFEDFYRKMGHSMRYIVLKISPLKNNYNDSHKITIKYGYSYEYTSGYIFYPILMGLAFCFPNLVIHVLNYCTYQREHLNQCFFILDLLLLVGSANILALYIYIGGIYGFYVGIAIIAIYGISSICFYFFLFLDSKRAPSGWMYFFKKLFLPSINEAVNENVRLQPLITVKAISFHQESREVCKQYSKLVIYNGSKSYYEQENGKFVLTKRIPFLSKLEKFDGNIISEWGRVDQGGGKLEENYESNENYRYEITTEKKRVETWKEESELKYTSWKDDTNFFNQDNAPVLSVNFDFKFNLYNDTENDLKKLKSEKSIEAMPHDTKIEIKEVFSIPGFKEKIICRPRDTILIDLLYLLIAFIFSIIGFSSFVNFFAYYEEKKVNVTIIKSIASSDIYENPYTEQIINEDKINISSYKKGIEDEVGIICDPLIIIEEE